MLSRPLCRDQAVEVDGRSHQALAQGKGEVGDAAHSAAGRGGCWLWVLQVGCAVACLLSGKQSSKHSSAGRTLLICSYRSPPGQYSQPKSVGMGQEAMKGESMAEGHAVRAALPPDLLPPGAAQNCGRPAAAAPLSMACELLCPVRLCVCTAERLCCIRHCARQAHALPQGNPTDRASLRPGT